MSEEKKIFKIRDLIFRPSEIIEHVLKYGKAIVKEPGYMLKLVKKGDKVLMYTKIKVVLKDPRAINFVKTFKTPFVKVYYISLKLRNVRRNSNVEAFRKWFDKKAQELIDRGILIKLVPKGKIYMCIEPEPCKEFIDEVNDKIINYYKVENDVKFTYIESLTSIETVYQYL